MYMRKFIIVALMVALVSLMIIGPVTATDYEYWDTHFISGDERISAGSPPNGIVHVYTDTTAYSDTILELAIGQGWSIPYSPFGAFFKGAYPGQEGIVTTHNIFGPVNWDNAGLAFATVSTTQISAVQNPFEPNDNYAYQILIFHSDVWHPVGPMYVIHKYDTQPINANFTYTPEQPWIDPAEIQFTDTSTGPLEDERYWEIGEVGYGTLRSWYSPGLDVFRTIEMTFPYSGNFYVNLTVTNNSISDTKTEYFTVYNPTVYDISVTPDYVPADGSVRFTGAITTSDAPLTNITGFQWTWGVEGGSLTNVFYDISNPSATLAFTKKADGHYWQHDGSDYNIDWGTNLPNNLLFFPPGVTGNVVIKCGVSSPEGADTFYAIRSIGYDLSGNPIESPDGLFFPNQIQVIVNDAFTSLRVYNPVISLYNTRVANWTNVTAPTGDQVFNVPIGDQISVFVDVEGGIYLPWNVTTIAQKDQVIYANLYYADEIPPDGNVTRLIVRAAVAPPAANSGTPIQGIQIGVHNPANTSESYYGVTDSAGKALFDVSPSTNYIISAYGGTYVSTSKSINTGTGNPYEVIMWMSTATPTVTATPGGVTFTPTYTYAIPTVTPTGSATTLPGGGYGYSGFWGPIAEGLGGAGAEPGEMGILLASILIFAGFCIGGWSGAAYDPGAPFNGMGAISGGILGFVLSVAFGFIPIIWLVAIILISVFIYIFFRR